MVGIRGKIKAGVDFLTVRESGLAGEWGAGCRFADPARADAAARTTVVRVDAEIDALAGAVDEG